MYQPFLMEPSKADDFEHNGQIWKESQYNAIHIIVIIRNNFASTHPYISTQRNRLYYMNCHILSWFGKANDISRKIKDFPNVKTTFCPYQLLMS